MRRVNIWAVLVSAVVFWLVGGLWYRLLFGQRWMAVVGKTEAQLKAINPIPNYVLAFVLEIVIAGAIGWVTSHTGELNVKRGIRVALGMWLAFVATTFAINYGFEGAPLALYWITLGQYLVGMLLSGTIVGAWTSSAGNSRAARA